MQKYSALPRPKGLDGSAGTRDRLLARETLGVVGQSCSGSTNDLKDVIGCAGRSSFGIQSPALGRRLEFFIVVHGAHGRTYHACNLDRVVHPPSAGIP